MENLAQSEPVIEIEDYELGKKVFNFIAQDKHLARGIGGAASAELNKSGFIDDVGWIGHPPELIRCYVLIPIPAQMIRFDRECSEEVQEASVLQSKSPAGDETQSIINNREIYHEQ